ncbi:sensor histidine kinase [Jiangella anatolica]|nr:histidine kinase [Jiangella anatolica]
MIAARRALGPVLAVSVVALAAVTVMVGVDQGAPSSFLVTDTAIGLLFAIAGLVAWERRPEARSGPLLLAAGALWFVGSYAPTSLVPYAVLGFAFERYYDLVLAVLVLTFPDVPPTRERKVLLWLLAAAYVARSAARLFIDCGCVANPFAMVEDQSLFETTQVLTSAVIVAAALGVAVSALRRLLRAGPALRRVLQPIVAAGVAAALVAAWDSSDLITFIATGDGLVRAPEPWREIISWAILGVVGLIPLGFLAGTLRLRLAHGAIAPLALELDRGTDPLRLQLALRHALGDPSLELAIWDRDRAEWRHSDGRRVAELTEDDVRTVTRIDRDDEPIAALLHDRALREDPGLVAAATAVLRLAVENERLAGDVRHQLEEVRASRARLVEAAEAERRRIERNLHDGAQQRLIGVALVLREARTEARRNVPDAPFLHRLDDTADELLAAIDELRELARGIHPTLLTDAGLDAAVTSLARRSAVAVELDIELDGRLPAPVETTAYYVVAEALANVSRHARARSATVRLRQRAAQLQVEVIDDGDGGAAPRPGSGLSGLVDRLDAVAGSLHVDSPPGCGTRLRAVIPCG